MKRIYSVFLLLILPFYFISCEKDELVEVKNATIQWDHLSKTYNVQVGNVIQKSSDDDYFIGGYFIQDPDEGRPGCWFLKLNTFGEKVWEKTFSSNTLNKINDVLLTNDGGCVFVGSGCPYYFSVNTEPERIGQIGKLDTNGQLIWDYALEGGEFKDILMNKHGEYVVSSSIYTKQNPYSFYHLKKYFLKFSSKGELIWENVVEKTLLSTIPDEINKVIQNNSGEYIACGYRESTMQKDDCLVFCFDDSGIFKWEKTYGGSNDELFEDIKQTNDGGYIAVGRTLSKDGDVKSGLKEEYDAWIVKLDSIGSIEWEKTFGGNGQDYFIQVFVDSDENYIVGYQSTSKDSYFVSAAKFKSGLLKISKEGEVLWRKNIDDVNGYMIRSFIMNSDSTFTVLSSSGDSHKNSTWNRVMKIK